MDAAEQGQQVDAAEGGQENDIPLLGQSGMLEIVVKQGGTNGDQDDLDDLQHHREELHFDQGPGQEFHQEGRHCA